MHVTLLRMQVHVRSTKLSQDVMPCVVSMKYCFGTLSSTAASVLFQLYKVLIACHSHTRSFNLDHKHNTHQQMM